MQAEPRTRRGTRFGRLARAGLAPSQANTGLPKPGCGDRRLAQGLSRREQAMSGTIRITRVRIDR